MTQVTILKVGFDGRVLHIPVWGLCKEAKLAAALAAVPYCTAAAYLTIHDMLFGVGLKAMCGIVSFLFLLGIHFSREKSFPREPFGRILDSFLGTITSSICLYFLISIWQLTIIAIVDDLYAYVGLILTFFSLIAYYDGLEWVKRCQSSTFWEVLTVMTFDGLRIASQIGVALYGTASEAVVSCHNLRLSSTSSTDLDSDIRPRNRYFRVTASSILDGPPAAEELPPVRFTPTSRRFAKPLGAHNYLKVVQSSHR